MWLKNIFLIWTSFKVVIEFVFNVASVLCLDFFDHEAGGILTPQLEIEPPNSCIGRSSPNWWIPREVS